MILTLALRSLLARPIRSAVLAGGFGLGVAVMAALLGIGGVILEQARTPALVGGGDVIVGSATGRIGSARFVLSNALSGGSLGDRVKVASPNVRSNLYLIDGKGTTAIIARGGIPSRERELGDPETSGVESWVDTSSDRAWLSPSHEEILRTMDRFHDIPDVPERASSWIEWLYFNGQSGSTRFYLSFLAGSRLASGMRPLNVRLQLDRSGTMTSYSHVTEVTDEELVSAPDISAGLNTVRLVGSDYQIKIDLPAESAGPRASGEITVRAMPGQSLPPFTMRGARGWLMGYVVPVMAGELGGTIAVGRDTIDLTGGAGYHDHNWGFWEGVRWQWGQVKGDELSFVYGRVYPPADAADSARLPGFLVALGPQGPIGYSTNVSIDEFDADSSARPRRIVITGRNDSLAVTLDIAVNHVTTTRMGAYTFGAGMNFLQMRGEYQVSGSVGERAISFTAPGSAETFRGR